MLESGEALLSAAHVVWIVGEPEQQWTRNSFRIRGAGAEFLPWFTCTDLFRRLIAEGREDAPGAAAEAAASLELLLSGGHPADLTSDSILYSIIRRISRESIGTACLIDALADKMANLCRLSARVRALSPVVFDDAHLIDRPSLRVLTRFAGVLAAPDFIMVFCFPAGLPLSGHGSGLNPCAAAIYEARARLFATLAGKLKPRVEGSRLVLAPFEAPFTPRYTGFLEEAAAALVTQNYERAYSACFAALQNGSDNGDCHRVLALIHANLGFNENAYAELQHAIKLAVGSAETAHLHYLSGLLCTKRFYNFGRAKEHFAKGMEFVSRTTPAERLEEGWLHNGQSFVEALEAIRLPPVQKHARIVEILEREIRASHLIKDDPGAGSRYLRFNLLTNIAFLLEIQGQFEVAIKFWDQAFSRFIQLNNRIGMEFTKVYFYRRGVLGFKAGNVREALQYLAQAADIAGRANDRLSGERISYALGYIHCVSGNDEAAAAAFAAGLAVTLSMRDWEHVTDHAKGLMHCLTRSAREGWTAEYWSRDFGWSRWNEWRDHLLESGSDQAMDFWRAANPLEFPKPKLPAYIPDIDLEEAPPVDINRYLVTTAPQSLDAVRRPVDETAAR